MSLSDRNRISKRIRSPAAVIRPGWRPLHSKAFEHRVKTFIRDFHSFPLPVVSFITVYVQLSVPSVTALVWRAITAPPAGQRAHCGANFNISMGERGWEGCKLILQTLWPSAGSQLQTKQGKEVMVILASCPVCLSVCADKADVTCSVFFKRYKAGLIWISLTLKWPYYNLYSNAFNGF